jgi:leader peptidase (prepilin peptidase)/N-methyltransferase
MTAAGLLIGAALGLIAVPLVRWLPGGIEERLAQPAWTATAARPLWLVGGGAALGALLGALAPSPATLASGLVLLAVLLPASAIDLAWRVVPDTLIVAGALGGATVLLLTHPGAIMLTGAVGGLIALALALVARGGFGLGDVKLIAMLGVVLGGALPLAVVVGLLVASVVAVPLLVLRGRGATLPLVPFLAVGALVACVVPLRVALGL